MSDRKISVDDVVRLFVDQAKEAEGLFYDSVDGTEKVAADFTSMSDEQIKKWFEDYGLVMNSGQLNTGVMSYLYPEAEVGTLEFTGLPDKEGVKRAYDYFMEKVIDAVTDNSYLNNPNQERIGNPDERRYESKKYSSFKNQQTITENFRRFLKK